MEINNFYESNIYFRTSVRTCTVRRYESTFVHVYRYNVRVHTAVHGFSIKESPENVNKNGTFGLRPTRPTRPLR